MFFSINSFAICKGEINGVEVERSISALSSYMGTSSQQHELIMAAKACNKKQVVKLLSKGAELNQKGNDKTTYETYAIFKAVKNCSPEYVKFLIDLGADPKLKRPSAPNTPLLLPAIRWGEANALFLIKNSLVDVNATNDYGKSALMTAVYLSKIEIITELLKKDQIDLNAHGLTLKDNVLRRSLGNEDDEVLDMLLAHRDEITPFNASVITKAKQVLIDNPSEQATERLKKIANYEKRFN